MKKRIIYDPLRCSWRAVYFTTRRDYLFAAIGLILLAVVLLKFTHGLY